MKVFIWSRGGIEPLLVFDVLLLELDIPGQVVSGRSSNDDDIKSGALHGMPRQGGKHYSNCL